MKTITLTLLHPAKSVPMQNWTFEMESVIRIGRSTDNDVVLYSAVVSRRHIEIRRKGLDWEVVNLGANGTYISGQSVAKTDAVDGMIIRLAKSGPKIQINIEPRESPVKRQLRELQQAFAEANSSGEGNNQSDPNKETVVND
ncbi:MAG: FHA domain-containing protein [Microcystaceae cyanobacterium]